VQTPLLTQKLIDLAQSTTHFSWLKRESQCLILRAGEEERLPAERIHFQTMLKKDGRMLFEADEDKDEMKLKQLQEETTGYFSSVSEIADCMKE